MPNRTPQHGDVYRDEAGDLWLFYAEGCRDPKAYYRGQHASSDVEWRFVKTLREKRVTALVAHPADVPLPERLELVVNAGADERVAELEAQLAEANADRAALVDAMKHAVGVVPATVANDIRIAYRRARGRLLTRSER